MGNVYSLVEHFYEENSAAEQIIPQDAVEAYLRRNAWHGADDDELKRLWGVISLLITYVDQLDLYSLAALTVYDYQEIIYRYANERADFMLAEADINKFFAVADKFYEYLQRTRNTEDYRLGLTAAKEALYEGGYFFLPDRRDGDEFYSSLEHLEEVSPETMQRLNIMLDELLHRIDEYYKKPAFRRDMDRAVVMYAGPEYNNGEAIPEDERQNFWLGFWDFFLFDYHLIGSDAVPLRYYYEHERSNLSTSEQDILRDLLRSRFTVFRIETVGEDYVSCRNFFTGEVFELPVPELALGNYNHCILFGHIHSHGVMLLNYITTLTASPKLQKRMRDVVLRQFNLFKFQQPQAEIADFFARHGGVVRHTLQVMAGYAQLNVLKSRDVGQPIPENSDVAEAFKEDIDMLRRVASHVGFSAHEIKLLVKFFVDYLTVSALDKTDDILITAILLEFAQINGVDLSGQSEIFELLGIDSESVWSYMRKIHDALSCEIFDPRYLTEEAFIKSLYY